MLSNDDIAQSRLRRAKFLLKELKKIQPLYLERGFRLGGGGREIFNLTSHIYGAIKNFVESNSEQKTASLQLVCQDLASRIWPFWEQDGTGTIMDRLDVLKKVLGLGQGQTPSERKILAEIYRGIGVLSQTVGRHADARLYYEKSVETSKHFENPWMPETYCYLGVACRVLGDYPAARSNYISAWRLARLDKSTRRLEFMLLAGNELGNDRITNREYKRALDWFVRLRAVVDKIHDGRYRRLPMIYSNLGLCYRLNNKPLESMECYLKAMAFAEDIKNIREISRANHEIGMLHRDSGRVDKAIDSFLEAFRQKCLIKDFRGRLFLLQDLGSIAFIRGNAGLALELYGASHSALSQIKAKALPWFADYHNSVLKELYGMEEFKRVSVRPVIYELASENARPISIADYQALVEG